MSIRSWLKPRTWRGWFGAGAGARRLADMQFAVVDVDLTGTNVRRDRVTGVAALPVRAGAFRLSELRYCSMPSPSAPPGQSGIDWRKAYMGLREAIADSTIFTYNPAFVRYMMSRACHANDLPALGGRWIDLESAAAVMGREQNELTTMDYWLEIMKAAGQRPHDATYDVFSMAQLLQAVLAYSEDEGIDTIETLSRRQKLRAWLRGRFSGDQVA